ncbi:MAG TPA: glycosyltransferase 87 family protein [Solirubrobacteraceae bacterium]|nr:glycosyltransferase 87 family protein [Solirubrobacteraceae bacterium]
MASPPLDLELHSTGARGRSHRGDQAAVRALGSAGLVGLVACLLLLGANAASAPSSYVPSSAHRFPGWLAGPLQPFGFTTRHGVLEALVLAIFGCYLLVLGCSSALPARRIWVAVVLADVAALLAPPLLSSDVFGYLGFARLGVLHGLNPYSYTANAAPRDAIYPYLGWHTVTTPYGPLFTLLTYAIVPLGIAAGLWTLKLVAAAASLATIAVLWRASRLLGHTPKLTVAIYGLNPLVLVFAVAGAHNDALFGALIAAGALSLISARERSAGVSLIGALALKASAGLVIPFALLGSRRRKELLIWLLAGAVLVAAVSFAIFGTHLSGLWHALVSEQREVAKHSVPAEVSMLLGLGRVAGSGSATHYLLPESIRLLFIALFAAGLLAALWQAWRGAWWLDCYAWATLALLACSAWLLPWYGMWALLPASLSSSRRLQGAALVASAYCTAIKII